jgi:hypothetical protein
VLDTFHLISDSPMSELISDRPISDVAREPLSSLNDDQSTVDLHTLHIYIHVYVHIHVSFTSM